MSRNPATLDATTVQKTLPVAVCPSCLNLDGIQFQERETAKGRLFAVFARRSFSISIAKRGILTSNLIVHGIEKCILGNTEIH